MSSQAGAGVGIRRSSLSVLAENTPPTHAGKPVFEDGPTVSSTASSAAPLPPKADGKRDHASKMEDAVEALSTRMADGEKMMNQMFAMLQQLTRTSTTVSAGAGAGASGLVQQMSLGSATTATETKNLTSAQQDRLAAVASTTMASNSKLLGASSTEMRTIADAIGPQVSSATALPAGAAGALTAFFENISASGVTAGKKLKDLSHARNFGELLGRLFDESVERGQDLQFMAFMRSHIKVIVDLNERGGYSIAKAYHYSLYDEKDEYEKRGQGQLALFYQVNINGHAHLLNQATSKLQSAGGRGGGGAKGKGGKGGKGKGAQASASGETQSKFGGKGDSFRKGGSGAGAGAGGAAASV